MSQRRKFLKKSLLSLGAAGLLGSSCTSTREESSSDPGFPNINFNKKFLWKMVTTWPPNFPVVGEGCAMLAREIEKMSGGRMTIKVYGGGELIPALECFDAVSSGAIEMGHGASYYWAGKVPSAQFFSTVPFGMNAQQLNAWILTAGGQELWEEVYGKFNLQPYLCGNTGVQMGGWFNKEINSLADLKGLKMRIPGLGAKVLSKAGGTAVLVSGGEIYTNLERGVIDATEWIGPYHDYSMGFHNAAKYYYYPGWHEPGTALELMINKPKLQELPEDLQEIIKIASLRMNDWMLSEFESKNSLYLKKLVEEENVRLKRFPDEVLEALRNYTAEVVQTVTDKDPDSKKVYEAYQSFQNSQAPWSEVSERIFYRAILKPPA